MRDLPEQVNYSLNLHVRDGRRVTEHDLETMVTMRYDGVQQLAQILHLLPDDAPFTRWVRSRVAM
jgi:hypothetical protein